MRYILLTLLLLTTAVAAAQQGKRVEATYRYASNDENETLAEAKAKALQQAQTACLAREFGTIVSQTNVLLGSEEAGEADVRYFGVGEADVRGEWIETIGQPEYQVDYDEGLLVVSVKVCGYVRPIHTSAIDLQAKLLFNGTDAERNALRNATFHSGDNLYLYLKSPVAGSLALYVVDDDEEMTVQCLLPYARQTDGICPIQADREYVFFSKEKADSSMVAATRGLVMRARDKADINQFYLIFSPHGFRKASDTEAGDALPRRLSFRDFQKWLGKSRRRDVDMQVEKFVVKVLGK